MVECYFLLYIFSHIYMIIANIIVIILRIIIIITISAIIFLVIYFILIYYYYHYYYYYYYYYHYYYYCYYYHCYYYYFYILSCQQGNSPCIIVLYNGGSKALNRLLGRGRSCLVYTKPGMFGQGIVPKEIQSRLFNPVSNQNKTCTWKRRYVPN